MNCYSSEVRNSAGKLFCKKSFENGTLILETKHCKIPFSELCDIVTMSQNSGYKSKNR